VVTARAFTFTSPDHWALAAIVPVTSDMEINTDNSTSLARFVMKDAQHMLSLHDGTFLILDDHGQFQLCSDQGETISGLGPIFPNARKMFHTADTLFVMEGDSAKRIFELDTTTFQIRTIHAFPGLHDAAANTDALWLLLDEGLFRFDRCSGQLAKVEDLEVPPHAILSTNGYSLSVFDPIERNILICDSTDNSMRSIDIDRWLPEPASVAGYSLVGNGKHFLLSWVLNKGFEGFLAFDDLGNILAKGRFSGLNKPTSLSLYNGCIFYLLDDGTTIWLVAATETLLNVAERRLLPSLDLPGHGLEWLCADITAKLPKNATLKLRWASTDQADLKYAVDLTLQNDALSMTQRLETIDRLLQDQWSSPVIYVGEGSHKEEQYRLPLHAAQDQWLWIDLTITTQQLSASTLIRSASVRYGDGGLMQYLPAIYRADSDLRQGRRTASDGATRPLIDNSMRNLVAVLETTTDGIDTIISGLVQCLGTEKCDPQRLGSLAAMIGVPFHDVLSESMKRRLLGEAAAIIAKRGTRDGLLIMLGALLPDRRIRVRDRTTELAPITLGAATIAGSHLPALLTGPSRHIAKLNAQLILGQTALCKTDDCTQGLIAPSPQVLVEIETYDGERNRYGPAIEEMVAQMVPANVLPVTRWYPIGGIPKLTLEADETRLPLKQSVTIGGSNPLGTATLGSAHTRPTLSAQGHPTHWKLA
jgi:phage tail-like protein